MAILVAAMSSWGRQLVLVALLVAAGTAHAQARGNMLGRVAALQSALEDKAAQGWRAEVAQQHLSLRTEANARLELALIPAEVDHGKNLKKARQAREAPNPFLGTSMATPFFIDRALIPTFSCPHEFRLGRWGDGGKWVCLAHRQSRNGEDVVVVSIGCNGDTSFEKAVAEKLGVKTHTLDFSLSEEVFAEVSELSYMKLYPMGLTAEAERVANMEKFKQFDNLKLVNVSELVTLVGANYVDIMKVDCEGCEYGLARDLKELYTRDTVPFGQLLLELHHNENSELTTELLETMHGLGYRLFHTEVNSRALVNHEWLFETAFIHERLSMPLDMDPSKWLSELEGARGSAQGISPLGPLQAEAGAPWWVYPGLLEPALATAEADFRTNLAKLRAARAKKNAYAGTKDEVPSFVDKVMIPTYSCPHELRMGAWGDGGKWVCLAHRQSQNLGDKVVVSVGCNGETSFEAVVYRRLGVKTHTLDFSLSEDVLNSVRGLEYVTLHEVGLTEEKSRHENLKRYERFKDVKFINIIDIIELVGSKYIDIMKLDCEGCEYGVIQDFRRLYTRNTIPYGQLLFELHFVDNQKLTNELMQTMEVLGYRLFHVEINPFVAANGGYAFEVAYIHESLVKPSQEQ